VGGFADEKQIAGGGVVLEVPGRLVGGEQLVEEFASKGILTGLSRGALWPLWTLWTLRTVASSGTCGACSTTGHKE